MSVLLKFFSLVIYCFLSVYPAPDATINFTNTIDINLDGTGTIVETMYVSKAAVDACDDSNHRPAAIAALPGMEVKVMDGIECYALSETKTFNSLDELNSYLYAKSIPNDLKGTNYYIADPLLTGLATFNNDAGATHGTLHGAYRSPADIEYVLVKNDENEVVTRKIRKENGAKWLRSSTTINLPTDPFSYTYNSDRGYSFAQDGSKLTMSLVDPSVIMGATYETKYTINNQVDSNPFPIIHVFTYFDRSAPGIPATFNDVTSEAWYGEGVMRSYVMGLIDGTGNNMFSPGGSMTLAEASALAARINSKITKSDLGTTNSAGSPWYQPYVDYLTSHNIISTSTFSDYTRPATRGEMAYLFSRATPDSFLEQPYTFNPPDVSTSNPYYNEITRLYHGGIFTGSDTKGSFNSDTTITRCEVASIVARIATPAIRVAPSNYTA